jgi:ABC-2 type transport system permease protein
MPNRPQQSYLGKVALIAWREFRHTALTKGFIFGAVAVPVVMFGVITLMPFLISRESPPLVGTIVVADPDGTVSARAEQILVTPPSAKEVLDELASAEANPASPAGTAEALDAASSLAAAPQRIEVTWRVEPSLDAVEAIKRDVREGRILAGAAIPPAALDPANEIDGFELFIPSSLSPKHVRQISRALGVALEEERVDRSGLDAELLARLKDRPAPRTTRISPEGAEAEENTEARFLVPMAFMLLLWLTVFTSANYLLTTTIEEKSNKVMEVLLAAASPLQLLGGKIVGYALVSTVMLVMYGALGIAGLSALAMGDLVPTMHLVYLAIYFVIAYVMVAAMMSAVGSAVSDLREAQSLVGPVMTLLLVPLILWMPITQDPNGLLATITSFIPPASPFVMILRLTAATEPVPLWQIVAATAWGFVSAAGLLWLAARIFRVGVLMQGKPPTPKELIRWAFVR